jgi:hypothetical protein
VTLPPVRIPAVCNWRWAVNVVGERPHVVVGSLLVDVEVKVKIHKDWSASPLIMMLPDAFGFKRADIPGDRVYRICCAEPQGELFGDAHARTTASGKLTAASNGCLTTQNSSSRPAGSASAAAEAVAD